MPFFRFYVSKHFDSRGRQSSNSVTERLQGMTIRMPGRAANVDRMPICEIRRGVRDGLGTRIIHVTYLQSHPRGDLSQQLTVVILRKESTQESL